MSQPLCVFFAPSTSCCCPAAQPRQDPDGPHPDRGDQLRLAPDPAAAAGRGAARPLRVQHDRALPGLQGTRRAARRHGRRLCAGISVDGRGSRERRRRAAAHAGRLSAALAHATPSTGGARGGGGGGGPRRVRGGGAGDPGTGAGEAALPGRSGFLDGRYSCRLSGEPCAPNPRSARRVPAEQTGAQGSSSASVPPSPSAGTSARARFGRSFPTSLRISAAWLSGRPSEQASRSSRRSTLA